MTPQELLDAAEAAYAAALTPEGGFLPRAIPPSRLPAPWDEWVCAVAELPARYHGGPGVRPWLDALFAREPDGLEARIDALSEPQRDKLFAVLGVLGHAYRWHTAPPAAEEYERTAIALPAGIAAPWAALARRLGVPRVGNLFAMVFCNFALKDRPEGGAYANSDIVAARIEIAHPWLVAPEVSELRAFLLAPIETEARGAIAVRTGLDILRAVTAGDGHHVSYLLDRLRAEIAAMGLPFREFIQRKLMRAGSFLNLIQPTTIWGLDEGDGHGHLEGASGPQVGCLQVIDALLGVRRESPMAHAILRSRAYMPARHRAFVHAMEDAGRLLPDFVAAAQDRLMTELFNECLAGMEAWRRVHQVRGAMYLKAESPEPSRPYMSTGGVVALEDERIARFKASMEERVAETTGATLPEVPAAADEGIARTFAYLTAEDRAALLEGARRREFATDAVIIAANVRRAGLFIVREGAVRVENPGGLALAELHAGELFGEMSFIENTGASANVFADSPCVLDEIPREHVFALCAEREGFAPRLHQSLATLLSRRLARTSAHAAEIAAEAAAPTFRGRPARHAEAIPTEAVAPAIAALRDATVPCATALDAARDALATASDSDAEALHRAAYDRLMASRVARAILGRGDARHGEWAIAEALRHHTSEGPGDAWVRALPTLRGIAALAPAMAAELARELESVAAPQVLAVGAAPLSFLDAWHPAGAAVECLDASPAAADASRQRAAAHGIAAQPRVTNILRLARSKDRPAPARHHALVFDALMLGATDDEALALLDWAAEKLLPGGLLLFASLRPDAEDRRVLGHLLDWLPEDRPDEEVRRLLQESALRDAPLHAAPVEPRSPVWIYTVWR